MATWYQVKPLLVTGDYACFTRPEFKVERVSYEVITPSAARGIIEAVLWKPEIAWRITKLHVLKEVQFVSLMRNEVKSKAATSTVRKARRTGDITSLAIDATRMRIQRRTRMLQDVAYVIEAEFRCTKMAGPKDPPAKYLSMFHRRASQGQCFHRPYLGCREFPAHFELLDEIPEAAPELRDKVQFGWMLYDIHFGPEGHNTACYYKPEMVHGVITVPPPDSPEVLS